MSNIGRRKRRLDEQKTAASKPFECGRCGVLSGSSSYLSHNFKVLVCDECRDEAGRDVIITKTTMIQRYSIVQRKIKMKSQGSMQNLSNQYRSESRYTKQHTFHYREKSRI